MRFAERARNVVGFSRPAANLLGPGAAAGSVEGFRRRGRGAEKTWSPLRLERVDYTTGLNLKTN